MITAMGAGVEIGAEGAVGASDYEHGMGTDRRGEKISVVGELALVAEIDPTSVEYKLHFAFEDFRIGIDCPPDPEHAILPSVIDILCQNMIS